MKRPIKVTVEGMTGAGKSTVAAVITLALQGLGFTVKLVDEPDWTEQHTSMPSHLTAQIMKVDHIKATCPVTVETKQVKIPKRAESESI